MAGHLNLLEKCECNDFISARGVQVEDILSSRQMRHFQMPELEDLLSKEPVPHYPYEKTFDQAKSDTFLVLQTSGSTGLPKPIPINHAWSAAVDSHKLVPQEDIGLRLWPFERATERPKLVRDLVPFAPFHVIAAQIMMIMTVFGNKIYVSGPLDRLMNTQTALQILDVTRVDTCFFSPAMLEEMVTMPDALERLAKLSEVVYGGGA